MPLWIGICAIRIQPSLHARDAGLSRGDEPEQFRAPLQTGDWRQPRPLLQKLRIAGAKPLLENNHCTVQEISDSDGDQDVGLFPSSYFSDIPAFHPVLSREIRSL